MSSKFKSSRNLAVDRPFDPKILDRARKLASQYKIIVWFEDSEYYGHGLEIPNAMNDGKTPDACIRNVRETLVTAVAVMLEDGEIPPAPATEGRRTEQVNIRLTSEERLSIEVAAQSQGFSGLSDFIRAAAIEKIR